MYMEREGNQKSPNNFEKNKADTHTPDFKAYYKVLKKGTTGQDRATCAKPHTSKPPLRTVPDSSFRPSQERAP